jgi:hypothetical protein
MSKKALWGGVGGGLSGCLTAVISPNNYPLGYAGLVFALCLCTPAFVWKHNSSAGLASIWRDIGAFILLGVVAPWSSVGTAVLADRIVYHYRDFPIILSPVGKFFGLLIPLSFAACVWALCLATALRVFVGKWERRFMAEMGVTGTVLAVAIFELVAIVPSLQHESMIALLAGGQVISGLLLGAGLERLAGGTAFEFSGGR